jgi:hypothetical protein
MGVSVFVCALVSQQASAAPVLVSLSNLNSTATFQLTPPGAGGTAGMNNWTVDGTDQLQQQWFWYRLGPTGSQYSLDTLVLQSESVTGTNVLNVTYADPAGQFAIDLSFDLTGGSSGSGTADVGEQVRIRDTGSNTLDFHLFQYTNFDLNDNPAGDTVQVDTTSRSADATQTKGNTVFADTVATAKPSHYEAGDAATILSNLTGATPDNLSDVAGPVSPADAAWAFQWDTPVRPNGSYLVSEDKEITGGLVGTPTVPLPGALWLGLPCLIGLALPSVRRRLAYTAG